MFKFLIIFAIFLTSNVSAEISRCGSLQKSEKSFSTADFHIPWHVELFSNDTENRGVVHEPSLAMKCGGTLINETTVVTNARCLWSDKYGHIGSVFDFFVGIGRKEKLYPIRKIHVLRGYEPSGDYSKSIALLELRDPLKFEEDNVEPICLDFNGTDYRTSNWTGFIVDVRNEHSQQIQQTVVALPQEDCKQILPGDISRDKFCVRPMRKETTSCSDNNERRSGSGLYDAKIYNGTERFFLRGVVTFSSVGHGSSSGHQCSDVIVVTNASNYASFILGH